MSLRSIGYTVLVGLVFVLAVSVVAGSVLGQPVLLSYVETGSMEPTLEPGDGFVAIPAELAGPVDEGDVIVFEAEEIQGGGLTTHRVVGETDRGFLTRGDANPFTDQDGSEPPVKGPQVAAVAWQPGGSVVVIPHLGTAIEGVQAVLETVQRQVASLLGTRAVLGSRGLAYLLFAVTLVWYVVGEWRAGDARRRERARSRDTGVSSRLVVGLFALLLVAGATAAMIAPAGTQQYSVVSAEFESDRSTVVPAGQSESVDRPLANGGLVPVVVYLEPGSEGVEIQPRRFHLSGGEQVNATVILSAPDETGYYRRFVTRHRYLAVLPPPVIGSLHELHPWAPIVAIDAAIAVPFYFVGVVVVGSGRIRRRSRSRGRNVSAVTRLRRAARNLYR